MSRISGCESLFSAELEFQKVVKRSSVFVADTRAPTFKFSSATTKSPKESENRRPINLPSPTFDFDSFAKWKHQGYNAEVLNFLHYRDTSYHDDEYVFLCGIFLPFFKLWMFMQMIVMHLFSHIYVKTRRDLFNTYLFLIPIPRNRFANILK